MFYVPFIQQRPLLCFVGDNFRCCTDDDVLAPSFIHPNLSKPECQLNLDDKFECQRRFFLSKKRNSVCVFVCCEILANIEFLIGSDGYHFRFYRRVFYVELIVFFKINLEFYRKGRDLMWQLQLALLLVSFFQCATSTFSQVSLILNWLKFIF